METTTVAIPVEPAELEKAVLDSVAKKIKVYPRRSIWASQLGHPCLRYNQYALTRWQDQQTHDAGLQMVFDEGNLHEQAVLNTLREAGFRVRQSQRPLDEPVKRDGKRMKYNISGRLDTEINHPLMGELWVPAEIKSMASHIWESIDTLDDLRNHKQHYIRGYIGQLNLYLLVMGKDLGLFIFKNKQSGALKFIWCPLDYQLGETLLHNAEDINQAVERIEADPANAESYLSPRIHFDEKICGRCAFNHICLPDAQFGGVELEVDEEIEAQLRKREELKPLVKEFEEIDEAIKGVFKKRADGLYLVAASFNVKVKEVEESQRSYTIPKHKEVRITAVKTPKQ